MRIHPRPFTAACLAAASLAAVGCGSSSKPAVCNDKAAFQDSVDKLKRVDVKADGVDALRTQLKDVQGAATTLVGSARKQYGPQAQQVQSALSSLGTAVRGVASAPSGQGVAEVTAAVGELQTASKNLANALSSTCD